MGSFQTSRHSPSYGHRPGPNQSLVSEDRCSSVLQTTCQPLQSFHCDLASTVPAQCLHSPSIQSRSPTLIPISDPYPLPVRQFIKNLGKIVVRRFLYPSFTSPPPTSNFSDQPAPQQLAMAVSVCLSVRPSQIGVLSSAGTIFSLGGQTRRVGGLDPAS